MEHGFQVFLLMSQEGLTQDLLFTIMTLAEDKVEVQV